jgi:hypothetical protein
LTRRASRPAHWDRRDWAHANADVTSSIGLSDSISHSIFSLRSRNTYRRVCAHSQDVGALERLVHNYVKNQRASERVCGTVV